MLVQCNKANFVLYFLNILTAGFICSIEFIPVLRIIGFLNLATCSING